MAPLSYDKYKISDTVDVAYFEPFYLKDFIAGK
jgi:tRNA threonylcarbamoyladenosine biosynthesis protein TsaB